MKQLQSYIPTQTHKKIIYWLEKHQCQLKICNPRATKLGDYQFKNNKHHISINNNLNPYSFLITLTHEIAHMMVFEEYKNTKLPHGLEWKNTFRKLMFNFIPIFPQDIQKELSRHLKNPKASTTTDPKLYLSLSRYNKEAQLRVCDLKDGTIFYTNNGKSYVRLNKVRTRIKCKSLENNKHYLFNPICTINLVK